jgi:hypothetical protein
VAKVTEQWVYGGERRLTKGAGVVWYKLAPDGERYVDEPLYFPKKGQAGAIGGIYTVNVIRDGDSLSMVGKPRYTGDIDKPKVIAEWTALADAARIAAAAENKERKAKDTKIIYEEVLAPFRRAYANSDPVGRQVILAKVLRAITSGAYW